MKSLLQERLLTPNELEEFVEGIDTDTGVEGLCADLSATARHNLYASLVQCFTADEDIKGIIALFDQSGVLDPNKRLAKRYAKQCIADFFSQEAEMIQQVEKALEQCPDAVEIPLVATEVLSEQAMFLMSFADSADISATEVYQYYCWLHQKVQTEPIFTVEDFSVALVELYGNNVTEQ